MHIIPPLKGWAIIKSPIREIAGPRLPEGDGDLHAPEGDGGFRLPSGRCMDLSPSGRSRARPPIREVAVPVSRRENR